MAFDILKDSLREKFGTSANPKAVLSEVNDALQTQAVGNPQLADNFRAVIEFAIKKQERNEILEDVAIRDPLTGAFNRRPLNEKMAELDISGASTALIVFDLDNFKGINDKFGHHAADEVLIGVVETMSETLHGYGADAKRHHRNAVLARTGGDEFTILLPDASFEEARIDAQAIVDRIAQHPFMIRGTDVRIPVTVSAGVTERQPGQLLTEAAKDADKNLYRAKEAGRGGVSGGAPQP